MKVVKYVVKEIFDQDFRPTKSPQQCSVQKECAANGSATRSNGSMLTNAAIHQAEPRLEIKKFMWTIKLKKHAFT